jgi:hypothetical protein
MKKINKELIGNIIWIVIIVGEFVLLLTCV